MITKLYYLIHLTVILSIMGCQQGADNSTSASINLLPAGPGWGALYQQRSGEYKALCLQAYNIANLRLEIYAKQRSALPNAIITDIDETVLDNSPYFINLLKKGKIYSDYSWVSWTSLVKCDTLPGAVRFLKRAKELGVTVFYVTNRFAQERQATLKNLKKFGLPNTDDDHLLLMENDVSSKESRRAGINKNYNVVLYLGDNLGDFSKDFDTKNPSDRNTQVQSNAEKFGDHFIVFPNMMYGSWEDRLYQKGEHTIEEKNSLLKKLVM